MSHRLVRARATWSAAVALVIMAWCGETGAQSLDDLFDDSALQDVQLRVSQRDWEALTQHPEEDTSYPADLVWSGVTVRNVGIRHRGFGTRNGAKPNLRVDFNRYLNEQSFLGLHALVLDNVYSDASMVRETAAMKLFASMGVPAPREAHARLFVNERFVGVYVLVEPVDRTFISRVFGAAEASPEDGGFLYEFRWITEYGFSYLGPLLAPYAEMFRPQTRDTDSAPELYAPLEELIRTVNEVPAGRFEAEVGRLVDLPALVRFMATESCMAEIDGFNGHWGANNFYIYRFRDGRPAVLLPWDADHAFASADLPVDFLLDANVLASRAMRVPSLRRQYLLALDECAGYAAQLAGADPRGWLEREVARLAALIAPYVALDMAALFTPEEFRKDVAFLLEFARRRPVYVRCEVAKAMDFRAPTDTCAP